MTGQVSRSSRSVLNQVVSVAVSAAMTLSAVPTMARSSDPAAPASLTVASNPAGAAVYVDGAFAGQTPLDAVKLSAGDHRVRVVKDGYLENGRLVNLTAGGARNLDVKLTKFDGPAAAARASAAPAAAGDEGSFFTSPLFLIAAGGGAAAAFLLLHKSNKPPVPGTITVTPTGSGMAGATSFSFTSTGSSDPDKDPLTYTWDFGDAGTGTGATATHTYAAAGTYTVKLTISDGKLTASPPNAAATVVGNLAGSWSGGTESAFGANIALVLTQSGGTLGGTLQFSGGLSGSPLPLSGTTSTSYPATVSWQSVSYTVTGLAGTFITSFAGTSNGTTMVGTVTTTTTNFGTFTNANQTFHK